MFLWGLILQRARGAAGQVGAFLALAAVFVVLPLQRFLEVEHAVVDLALALERGVAEGAAAEVINGYLK